jgi:hypothetical protein
MYIKILVVRIVTPCKDVVGYQRFGGLGSSWRQRGPLKRYHCAGWVGSDRNYGPV